jgi:murein L,D-transpeptidase YcbB/YkuD
VAPADRQPPADPATAPGDGGAVLEALLAARDPARAVEALAPAHYAYRGLVRALAAHREVHAAGGFPPLGDGPPLRRDDVDPRVPALRRRLALSGDLPAGADLSSPAFDAAVEEAVRRFQHRHGLNEDGVVGATTQEELGVPVETRIDQIRVNLERARWIVHDLPAFFVAVNVAGQRLYVVRDGAVVWETRVVVGKEATRTPIFSAPMRYVVLNPTWSVPRSIGPEVLADVRRDPSYLEQQGFRVLDAAGREVDPAAVDFERGDGADFPYLFRQQPGPDNALGRIKLMFPNPYSVYLHDTPARSLFARERRTFSHGCIRVEDPLRLAELVLDDPERWSRGALEAAIATGATRTAVLARPLPVLVLYWTAATDLHGELHFYRDVYGRDEAVLLALAEPPGAPRSATEAGEAG